MWERFLSWEVAAGAASGAIDLGTHMIAVLRVG